MLKKLIKYDFRSLSRVLAPMQLCVLAASILCAIFLTCTNRWQAVHISGVFGSIITSIVVLFTVIVVIAIIASALITLFLIVQRFYRSFLSSEGYLSFTLPVTTTQLMWSKLITAFIWELVSIVVVIASTVILIFIGSAYNGILNMDLIREMGDCLRIVFDQWTGMYTLFTFEIVILLLLGVISQILELYFAVIVGGMLSSKHRILAAIGSYFVINGAIGCVSIVAGILMALPVSASNVGINPAASEIIGLAQPHIILYMFLYAGTGVLFFALGRHLLKNRLNLD